MNMMGPKNYNPELCPREMKIYVHIKTSTQMFVEASFITIRNFKK